MLAEMFAHWTPESLRMSGRPSRIETEILWSKCDVNKSPPESSSQSGPVRRSWHGKILQLPKLIYGQAGVEKGLDEDDGDDS